ncbi:hypothetical protein E1212_06630 [Jiangella ureilytica]|uniref:Uncharacterized protein n=1 Tax=Jiangella ureilytica TaxID=2530374 RepID=A0A4R4RUS3_9ACTN|nr:hypothetical protein [Jiangella ureilytica]TDC53089.1 hypothetical protein E1212_06630 [Jiangella ureilytica]
MTQQPAQPHRGSLRAAIEGLLRTCVDLERQAEGVSTDTGKRVRGLAETLIAVQLPRAVLDVPALVQEVGGLGRQLDADLNGRLAEARRPLVTEIHTLLALLAPVHGLAALPPLVPVGPGAALADHFPTGFAREYVDDLLGTVDTSVTLTTQSAVGVPVESERATDAVKLLVGQHLPENFRDEGVRMLRNGLCHTVERHGHHIAPETQLARLVWRKDPSGHQAWQVLPGGGIATSHGCGPAAGGFTSAEALAKTLAAFLRWAHDHAGGVNELIKNHTSKNAKRIGIHMSATLAGLTPGETDGFRGTATGSAEKVDDWLAARRYAVAHGKPPVYGVPYDPIAEGEDPGVTLAFKRVGHQWHLVTCYPVDEPDPRNKRLEDLA